VAAASHDARSFIQIVKVLGQCICRKSFAWIKSAIEVATGDELLKALSLVAKAVEAGELDAQIESASNKLKEGFGK
jgi:hypothetical protein